MNFWRTAWAFSWGMLGSGWLSWKAGVEHPKQLVVMGLLVLLITWLTAWVLTLIFDSRRQS